MPDPVDPSSGPPPPLPEVETDAARREREEREATMRVLNVWSILPGRFPFVTVAVILTSIAIAGASAYAPERTFRLVFVSGTEIWGQHKWWGLIASIFLHGGALHLILNLGGLWLFGRVLERVLGHVRYLGLLLATAWMASVAQLAAYGDQGVGLSGVIYGLFGYLFVSRDWHVDFRRVLPASAIQMLFAWLGLCFILTFTGVLKVANGAHVGGLLAGILLGLAAHSERWRWRAREAAVALALVSFVPVIWCPWQREWHVAQAYRALVAGDEALALERLTVINGRSPSRTWALQREADLRWKRREYARVRDLYTQVPEAEQNAETLNSLAWLLATCPDAAIRNGTRAVELAQRACKLDDWKNPALLDTLAAAYAEAGDFPQAEKWMVTAQARPGGTDKVYADHLAAFRAGQPWREDVPTPDPAASREAKK
jgi:membrane associated rhomboid family serine protease